MPRSFDDGLASSRTANADSLALFAAMWALAALWHLLANPLGAPAWSQALVAVGIGATLLHPGAVVPLGLLAASSLVLLWEEAPVLGNHWLLVGCIDVAILVALAMGAVRGRFTDRTDLADRVLPAARLSLVGFYAFAGFAKLNDAFLDPSVSCATLFYRETTTSIGVEGLQLGGTAWVARTVVVGVVALELALPILLVIRRLRSVGVVLGLVFHLVVALDRIHPFFDFSAVLFALLVLFLPPSSGAWVAERVGSVRARLDLRGPRHARRARWALAGAPVGVALLVAIDVLTVDGAREVGWWPWQLGAGVVVVSAVRFLRQPRSSGPPARLLPHHLPQHAVYLVAPLLVLVNGLTPYLEVKTGYGWNMYANLRTVDGDTNHLLLPGTLPLTDEQEDVVRIISTDDAGLAAYAARDYALTWTQLRGYLAERPSASITYQRGAERVALERASDRPELVEPVPAWREKLLLFRPIDLSGEERCLPTMGPGR